MRQLTATIIGVSVLAASVLLLQGCDTLGFLASPGPFEKKVDPEYDLKSLADKKKIYIFVEASSGSGAGVSDADLLGAVVGTRIQQKTGIKKTYIQSHISQSSLFNPLVRPEQVARDAGADLVLYIHLEQFEILNLQGKELYSGKIMCRSVLIDVNTGATLWPSEGTDSKSDVESELSVKGRDEVIAQLNAATAHCIVRHFYACAKTDYRVKEERNALNEMIQQDVY